MSSAQVAAKSIRSLELEDWSVLEAIEESIPLFESVPLHRIQKLSKLHHDQVLFRLDRLNSFGFVMRTPFGYILNTAGLDALALNALVKKGLISGMGKSIGMGKESDVFEVISESGIRSVIKFYRIGRISFRATRKKRSFVSPESQHQWLTINIGAAQKEAEALVRAKEAGVDVPDFIARDRHAVLMSRIYGVMLHYCVEGDIEDPKKLLTQILENARKAYTKAKMISGDLSEYNILFDGERPWIIDWPQFVYANHPNAKEMLERDVENSISYFTKKFGLKVQKDDAVSFVTGKTDSLEIT